MIFYNDTNLLYIIIAYDIYIPDIFTIFTVSALFYHQRYKIPLQDFQVLNRALLHDEASDH